MEPIGVAKLIPDNFGQWNETVTVDPRDKLFAELKFWTDWLKEGYEIGVAEHEWLDQDKENLDHKIIIKVHTRIKELVNQLLPDVSCETSPEVKAGDTWEITTARTTPYPESEEYKKRSDELLKTSVKMEELKEDERKGPATYFTYTGQ